MTDYERIKAKAMAEGDFEEWETIWGQIAITIYYNMYYQETYIFAPSSGEQIDYEELVTF